MKIQRIQNSFTTEVYEKNARLCLEIGDMQQYKVCQGQLIDMYREGLPGKKYEFYMYRIVYLALNSEKFELNKFLKEMSVKELGHELVQEGVRFKTVLVSGNIKKVFEMYRSSKVELLGKLISLFLQKLRIWALQIISKSFGKQVKIEFVKSFLEFDSMTEAIEFLTANAVLSEDGVWLDLKKSRVALNNHILMALTFE